MGDLASAPPCPSRRVGEWELDRLLGRGAMASVYQGHRAADGRRAAIKLLHPHLALDEAACTRFLREARNLARIVHPNVVEIFEVGQHDGHPYLAMSIVDGEDLGDHLRRLHPMSMAHLARCLLPVIDAVAAVHDAGVVHRDLKPSNIRLTRSDGGLLTPKVLDFGLSKRTLDDPLPADLTDTGTPLGTLSYMSPEQLRSTKHVDARTDVYALGVVLYECATGLRPFRATNAYDLMHAIFTADLVLPSTLRKDLSSEFDALVACAMNRDPAQRFASAREMGAAFAELVSEGSASAAPSNAPADVRSPDERSVLQTIRGSWLHMTDFANGVVRHSCEGRFGAEFVPFITAHGDEQIKKCGRVVFMVDGCAFTVNSDFRDALAAWLRAHRDNATAHILIRSKLVDMAISVTNLFTGKPVLFPHSSAARWEAIGRREDPAFKRLPPGSVRPGPI